MASKKNPTPSANNNISISGDVKDSAVFIGNNNTVNQTIIQKFFNIFKSDSETLEQRNRRILLGHVENAWIKGVLDASLHGAALLDLGIKQDPEAVTKYPWAIKKESTDETLPAGTSMLEIFDSIGMGRSLLILGAPGSGKTTMLLELARHLIARAREDVTYPIPMVFNLASWTEKLTLADWLAQELNNLYSVPRKTAPDWVKGDKLLLLLDGLDEVRQESRAKCVEAINEFRKEHGLTSLAVCSRSQDYTDLNAKLSFEGAIEVQPLTQKQITEFFNRFGKEVAGIKQSLEKDSALREMAETPLFLSIMIMAYQDKRDVEILVSGDEKTRRKHLFETYVDRMFERTRLKNVDFKRQNMLHWLSWLASKMIQYNLVTFMIEDLQPRWLDWKRNQEFRMLSALIFGLIFGLLFGLVILIGGGSLFHALTLSYILGIGLIAGVIAWRDDRPEIKTVDTLTWDWKSDKSILPVSLFGGLSIGLIIGLIVGLNEGVYVGLGIGFAFSLGSALLSIFVLALKVKSINVTTYFGQRISLSIQNSIFIILFSGLVVGGLMSLLLRFGGNKAEVDWQIRGLTFGLLIGSASGLMYFGGVASIRHYILRHLLQTHRYLPLRLSLFFNHCCDLVFLRRVGGGYIFVHRLLMEHFAEMYMEDNA
jgi:hypothetical protein